MIFLSGIRVLYLMMTIVFAVSCSMAPPDSNGDSTANYLFLNDVSTGRCVGQIEKKGTYHGFTLFYVKSDTGYHAAVYLIPNDEDQMLTYAFPTKSEQEEHNYFVFVKRSQLGNGLAVPYIDINETYLERPFYVGLRCDACHDASIGDASSYIELASDYQLDSSVVTINNLSYKAAVGIDSLMGHNHTHVSLISDFTIRSGQEIHPATNVNYSTGDVETITGFPITGKGTTAVVVESETLPFDCIGHNNTNG